MGSDLPSESDYTQKVLQYYAHSDKAFYLTLLNGLFYLMIGSFGVVGIVKNRAKYLLPLLVVQIFDVISVMGVLCSVLFLTNRYDSFVEQLGNVVSEDFKEWILSLDPDWRFVTIVTYFAGMLFISILFAKAIYLTYKHITLEDIAHSRASVKSLLLDFLMMKNIELKDQSTNCLVTKICRRLPLLKTKKITLPSHQHMKLKQHKYSLAGWRTHSCSIYFLVCTYFSLMIRTTN